MASPCCPKCGGTNITYTTTTHHGTSGMYIYCGSCGAIITWVPLPK